MLLLALLSSAVALLLNLLLQMLVPSQPIATYTVSEIVEAVQHGAPWLGKHQVETISKDGDKANPAARAVADRIARRLHLPASDVWVEVSRAQGRRTILMHASDSRPELAVVGYFRLWIRNPGDGYTLYQSGPSGFLDDRLRRNLLLLAVTALVMLPVAWIVGRWMTRPFEQFALAADRLGRNPGAAPPEISGSSEAKRASAALSQMQQRIDSYVTDRTRMLAAIAHDLRTPLTRLAFRIETLPQPLADAMSRDVGEMQQMLKATMRFARADALAGDHERLDLGELVQELVEDMSVTSSAITYRPVSQQLFIAGDRLALRRGLANLISNAVQYGGNAVIGAARQGDSALITVDDDGPGVPPEALERLFEPFQRLETSRNRHTGGIGLGLPIARSTARAHGGDVVMTNRTGGGLQAQMTLPLVA